MIPLLAWVGYFFFFFFLMWRGNVKKTEQATLFCIFCTKFSYQFTIVKMLNFSFQLNKYFVMKDTSEST